MDSHTAHNLECARAAVALLIEKAETAKEKRELRDFLKEIEAEARGDHPPGRTSLHRLLPRKVPRHPLSCNRRGAVVITLDTLNNCTLIQAAHLDGPRGRDGWFGDMHRCVEYPRLQRRVRYFRKDRSHDVTWYVDGNEVGGQLSDAVAPLNTPPTLPADCRTPLEET